MPLSAPTQRIYDLDVALNYYPQAAVVAYHGGIAVLRAGYVRPGATATGDVCVGVFDFDAQGGIAGMTGISDNSGGSAGDLSANVRRTIARVKNSAAADAIAQANVGSPCFVVDDETVALTDGGGTRSVAGTIRRVDSAGVWVEFGSVNGTSLAAEITARSAITTNLASTANAKGASLVGIEDSAGKITATTVEGALAENLDGRRIAVAAAGNTLMAVDGVHIIAVADGSTVLDALTLDATFGKFTVTDVWFQKNTTTGGSTDAVQLCIDSGGATAVTDSLALNTKASGAIVRAANVVAANAVFAAGAHLYVKRTHTTDCGGTLYVRGYRTT
jgi:hypothetical protein